MLRNAPLGDYPFPAILALATEETLADEQLVDHALVGNSLSALTAVLAYAHEDGSGVELRHEDDYTYETSVSRVGLKRALKAAIAARLAVQQRYREHILPLIVRWTRFPAPIALLVLAMNNVLLL
jgi:hypothetical protein